MSVSTEWIHLSMPKFSIPAHVSANTLPFSSQGPPHKHNTDFHLTVVLSHTVIMCWPILLVDGYHADCVWNHESAFPWIDVIFYFFQSRILPLWQYHQVLSTRSCPGLQLNDPLIFWLYTIHLLLLLITKIWKVSFIMPY